MLDIFLTPVRKVNFLILLLFFILPGCNEFSSSDRGDETDESVVIEPSPIISISSLQDGDYINAMNQGSFLISGTCNIDADLSFNLGVGTIRCNGSSFSGMLDLSSLGEGLSTIVVTLTQPTTGETATSSINLFKDSQAPSLSMGSPNLLLIEIDTVINIPITINGASNFILTDQEFNLVGDTVGCTLEVLNGSSANPTAQISGCYSLEGTLELELGPVVITDEAGNSTLPITLVSDEMQIDTGYPFIVEYRIGTSNLNLDLPLRENFDYDFTINWGDGSPDQVVTSFDDINKSHTYSAAGDYIVTINGLCERFGNFGSAPLYKEQLLDVVNLGHVGWIDLSDAFSYSPNLISLTGGVVSGVVNMSDMFAFSDNVTVSVANWNTSEVTNMRNLFFNAGSVNPDVTNWDTSNVTNMIGLFYNADSANPNIANWDTSKVMNFNSAFRNVPLLNSDISDWDVSSAVSMYYMFNGSTEFDRDLSSWNVAGVTSCNSFSGGTSANWTAAEKPNFTNCNE